MDSKEFEPSVRNRRRRRLAILGAAVVLIVAWKAEPRIEDRILLYLAERAVANDHLDEARERLDILIAEQPGRPWPRFLRAQVARKRGNITEAEETLQRAIELGLPIEQARGEHALLVEQAVSDQLSAVSQAKTVAAEVATERK
jgi:predicted Zn-dependent protease